MRVLSRKELKDNPEIEAAIKTAYVIEMKNQGVNIFTAPNPVKCIDMFQSTELTQIIHDIIIDLYPRHRLQMNRWIEMVGKDICMKQT